MPDSCIQGETIDDAMHRVFEALLRDGEVINPTKGRAAELRGVMVEIANPRARVSRTETRGKPFSCLGELCWYLAGSDDLGFISHYISDYHRFADGHLIFGAYGPRLLNRNGVNQVDNVIEVLRRKKDSRQAVIQLFDATDLLEEHKDIPCTCTLQFLLRYERLDMFTSMRSNDAYLGLPHDIFSFTMLQELIARSLSVDLGTYKHAVGSLHVYDEHRDAVLDYQREGWQSTTTPMPPMPIGDPWPSVARLIAAEADIRLTGSPQVDLRLDPYWADLIRLLQVFHFYTNRDRSAIERVRDEMESPVYNTFIDQKLRALAN